VLLLFEELRKPFIHLGGYDSAVTEGADRIAPDSGSFSDRAF
jgi:hypothetical protein